MTLFSAILHVVEYITVQDLYTCCHPHVEGSPSSKTSSSVSCPLRCGFREAFPAHLGSSSTSLTLPFYFLHSSDNLELPY